MSKKISRKKFISLSIIAPFAFAAPGPLLSSSLTMQPDEFASNDHVTYINKDHPSYDQYRNGFNKRFDHYPAMIALCHDTTGVSEAIRKAAEKKWPVAVKSGGHCMEGFSGNTGGMIINLSAMKSISWITKDSIRIGPGYTLAEIYDILLPKKKIIPGGSCAGVGIGGLVLGGGYGLLSRKLGLTCDSLTGITMVDGLGKITSVSGEDELLWACRGGNNGNFGVVTELVFKLHPAPLSMQSFRFKSYKQNKEQVKSRMKKWFELCATLPNHCFSAFVQNRKTSYILLTSVGKKDQSVDAFITEMKSSSERFSQTSPQLIQKALKVYYGQSNPLYFKNASAGLYKSFTDIDICIEKVLDIVLSSPGMIFQVNTMGGKIKDPDAESKSSFPHRDFDFFSELQSYWDSPSQASKRIDQFKKVQQIIASHGISAQYRNYPDADLLHWADSYYGNNYTKLQELKSLYDPQNIFRYSQSIKAR